MSAKGLGFVLYVLHVFSVIFWILWLVPYTESNVDCTVCGSMGAEHSCAGQHPGPRAGIHRSGGSTSPCGRLITHPCPSTNTEADISETLPFTRYGFHGRQPWPQMIPLLLFIDSWCL